MSATGCGNSGSGAPGSAPAGTTPPPTPPVGLCVTIVGHWSRELLDGDSYGDYQSMGLSNRQYDILREVLDAARPVKGRQGVGAAEELIDRRTREECARAHRDGGPSTGGPWR
ncbi:hypothetical protein ACLGIH_25915 [Streptomyces sp. HMX87]|uniref:hypothetical protein n=1 Tax=Streptomyces sp. HMX87 TaxID=3390849 RepID=UPI003A847174